MTDATEPTEPNEAAVTDAPDQLDVGSLDQIRPGAWVAPGQQMVVTDALVQGVRFSRHVTAAELAAGHLEVVPDFAAIAAFAHRADRPEGEVEVVELAGEAPRLVLRGADGWLDGGTDGATAVLSLEGERVGLAWGAPIEVVDVDPTPILATFHRLGGGQPVPLLDLVLHLLIDLRDLFTAEVPVPVRDLLLVAGLDVEGTTVLLAASRAADPVGLPGLGTSSALAAERLLGAVLAPDALGPEVLAALADPDAVAAVAEQVVGGELVPIEQLAALVEHLEAEAGPGAAGPVAFLRSRLAEWQGDTDAEEAALSVAIRTGGPAALVDAAWFAADRGDAREALALLRSAHVPADDPDLQLLGRYTATGPRWVGRNEPCWCGSGRKHKQCHLHLNGHDLTARAQWLHAKAVMFLQRPPQRTTLLRLATAAAGLTSPDDAPERVIGAACDVAVTEVCLFEAGVFARFVEHRGAVLPEDERELAAGWAAERLHVWEVLGEGAALKEVATGEERELDAWSRTKVTPTGLVLAVAHPGPVALPGPTVSVAPHLAEELGGLLGADDPLPLARLVGRELGWAVSPDLGSASAAGAEDELAPAP